MISFRHAGQEDLSVLTEIEKSCFHDPWSWEMLETELQMPNSHYMLMLQDDAVVGYYSIMHILDEVHILNVAVLPAYRGRGLGHQMMRHLLDNLPPATQGVTLEVRVGNAVARHLYESMGFHCVGIRPGYYMDKEDAAIYWRTEGV